MLLYLLQRGVDHGGSGMASIIVGIKFLFFCFAVFDLMIIVSGLFNSEVCSICFCGYVLFKSLLLLLVNLCLIS